MSSFGWCSDMRDSSGSYDRHSVTNIFDCGQILAEGRRVDVARVRTRPDRRLISPAPSGFMKALIFSELKG